MATAIDRETLFSEVWSTPMRRLAPKYGLSDSGLRKICVGIGIPLPGKGHWAKIAAGHQVPAPALPADVGRRTFVRMAAPVDRPAGAEQRQDPVLLAALAYEAAPENTVVVEREILQPHLIVRASAKKVWAQVASLERARAERALHKPDSGRIAPALRSSSKWPGWFPYLRCHVMTFGGDVLPMEVSIEQADRALRIWDAVIKACVARGMTVSLSANGLLVASGTDAVTIRMRERVKGSGEEKRASGELRIGCRESEFKLVDMPGRPVDGRLNDLLRFVHRHWLCVATSARWNSPGR